MAIRTVKTKKGVSYESSIRCKDRRQHRKRFESKWEAREFERLVIVEGLAPSRAALKAKGLESKDDEEKESAPSFREYVESIYIPRMLSGVASAGKKLKPHQPSTNYHVLKRLKIAFPFIGDIPIDQLSIDYYDEIAQRLLTERLNRCKNPPTVYMRSTADKILKNLRSSLNYAVKARLIKFNPWLEGMGIEVPPTQKIHWSVAQCTKFLMVVKEESCHDLLLFLLAITYGLRRSELFGIELGDIDFENETITIRRQWDEFHYSQTSEITFREHLKNGVSEKYLPMSNELRPHLKAACRNKIGASTKLLKAKVSMMKSTKKLVEPYALKAGIPPISLHKMRDSMISNQTRAGLPEAVIARVAGCTKANLATYQRFNIEDMRKAVNAIEFGV